MQHNKDHHQGWYLMELKVLLKGLDKVSRRKKKWVLGLSALGFSGYGVYKLYHFPSVAQRRQRLFTLLGAFVSIAEAVSDSAEAVGIVSQDMKEFLRSDSDQVPKSLRQLSKITRSDEFSESLIKVTNAMTVGVMRGYQSQTSDDGSKSNLCFTDHVMDKLFTKAGSGFASVVVGSFARNLIMAVYSNLESDETSSVNKWVEVACNENCRELIGDCIQKFVSTAVAIYLDKTMSINTYDQILSGLTNPKHEAKVRDVIVSVCNGAVETFVKTSHQVLTISDSDKSPRGVMNGNFGLEVISNALKTGRNSFNSRKQDDGWVRKMSSALALPSNRRLVLDVTSRVTFETVRSFLHFLVERLFEGLKRSVKAVRGAVIEGTAEVVRCVTVQSSVVATICISLCLHILGGVWILEPVNC